MENYKRKARRVFISVLGAGFYGECVYEKKDFYGTGNHFRSSKTRYIQQATLEYLNASEWTENDAAYILVTQKSREVNWNETILVRKNKEGIEESYLGLEKVLKAMHLPFEAKAVDIKNGMNEAEIWDIFETILSEKEGIIQDGDELYFDLTHGFRYLPMLVLVLGNYTKFLRKTKKCSITYGNFEMKDANGFAPIIDLLPLATLQDWTYAVADYVENGYATQLKKLSTDSLTPILSNRAAEADAGMRENALNMRYLIGHLDTVAIERQTCRGIAVTESKSVKKLKEYILQNHHGVIKAVTPLIKKIETSLDDFDEKENVLNTIAAAQWCFDNHLYQSATTFLEEGVVSFLCQRHQIDYKDEDLRGLVNSAFTIKARDIQREKWAVPQKYMPVFLCIINDPMLQDMDFVNRFYNFCSTVRNDYNHCGFRSRQKPLDSLKMVKKIGENIQIISQKLNNPPSLPTDLRVESIERPLLLLNLSNHPVETWSQKQLEAVRRYGNVVDMDFPIITPDATSEIIDKIAETYTRQVIEKASRSNITVHIVGEMTFTYAVVARLKALGIKCIASITERNAAFDSQRKKVPEMKFVQFREY